MREEGSIPAHAGEPPQLRRLGHIVTVYPRPRGGALRMSRIRESSQGLSPPTRGSPSRWGRECSLSRSIPAHAGEPITISTMTPLLGVYPRPRGGALACSFSRNSTSGLSPPTRGSPGEAGESGPGRGSIPAHAGEPRSQSSRASLYRVYPRPRGGARWLSTGVAFRIGLSPPTRGSHQLTTGRSRQRRSIPAHAGEPI